MNKARLIDLESKFYSDCVKCGGKLQATSLVSVDIVFAFMVSNLQKYTCHVHNTLRILDDLQQSS